MLEHSETLKNKYPGRLQWKNTFPWLLTRAQEKGMANGLIMSYSDKLKFGMGDSKAQQSRWGTVCFVTRQRAIEDGTCT